MSTEKIYFHGDIRKICGLPFLSGAKLCNFYKLLNTSSFLFIFFFLNTYHAMGKFSR